MKDALALTLAAIWFALNIALWATVPSKIVLFIWSIVLGAVFFAGFFGYLGYRDNERRGSGQE